MLLHAHRAHCVPVARCICIWLKPSGNFTQLTFSLNKGGSVSHAAKIGLPCLAVFWCAAASLCSAGQMLFWLWKTCGLMFERSHSFSESDRTGLLIRCYCLCCNTWLQGSGCLLEDQKAQDFSVNKLFVHLFLERSCAMHFPANLCGKS